MSKFKNEIILSGLVILLLFIFIFFMLRSRNSIEQYSTTKDEEVYYYIDDILVEYKGQLTLDRNNNITNISTNNGEWKDISEPIYFKNEEKVLFPNTMSIVRPTLGMKQNRLNYFTEVKQTPAYIKVTNVNLDANVSNAFLFDGVNTYFFIDDMVLNFNDHEMELPKFSYVRCGYKDYLYIYNYETKEMIANTNADYIVEASTNDYTINLSTDSLSVGEQSVILNRSISKLPVLE